MNDPSINEYKEAILFAEDNFEQLKNLRPVLDDDGEPVMKSGNFAMVFKMKDEQTGKLHAVKCFLRKQEGRAEVYRKIAEELKNVNSAFLTPIKYLDKELFVDTTAGEEARFPILLMDWVEGKTLDKYIREHIDDQYELSLLAYQFSRLAMWLMPQPFAHGDLKPDNILVKNDGTLVLVDYDGMYVPAMKGQKARELGSPDFRHPSRTETDFDEHIDDFSLASILLSLKAISLQPSLLEEYGTSDRLLLSANDYRNLSESRVMDAIKSLMQDTEMVSLYSLFILAISQSNLSQISSRLFNLSKQERLQYEEENLSTEVTDEDLANAWTDEFGVMYSEDRKRLLKASRNLKIYTIREGTKVICDGAFNCNEHPITLFDGDKYRRYSFSFWIQNEIESITIPNSVVIIGKRAFAYNELIKRLFIPDNVKIIKENAFYNCNGIVTIEVSCKNLFFDSRNNCNAIIETKTNTLIVGCSSTVIPKDILFIGNHAFHGCANLDNITIPIETILIGECAFSGCIGLSSLFIPPGIISIGNEAFSYCKNIKSVIVDRQNSYYDSRNNCNAIIQKNGNVLLFGCSTTSIPTDIEKIGDNAFSDCSVLINLPNSVKEIGNFAFANCISLTKINIPDNVTRIGNSAFAYCENIKEISIPNSVKEIGNSAFEECKNLTSITLPCSLTQIEEAMFYHCFSLQTIIIPQSVEVIQSHAFRGCPLHAIDLPCGLKEIGVSAFLGCSNLSVIFFPNELVVIKEQAFYDCKSLRQIRIPNTVTYIGEYAFGHCENLSSVVINELNCDINDTIFTSCYKLSYIFVSEHSKHKLENMLPKQNGKIVEKKIHYTNFEELVNWYIVSSRKIVAEEIADIITAIIVPSNCYGCSICIYRKCGDELYLPFLNQSSFFVGDSVDLSKAKMLILQSKDDNDEKMYMIEA